MKKMQLAKRKILLPPILVLFLINIVCLKNAAQVHLNITDTVVYSNELKFRYFNSNNINSYTIKHTCKTDNKNRCNVCSISYPFKDIYTYNYFYGKTLDLKTKPDFIKIVTSKYYLDTILAKYCNDCNFPIHGRLIDVTLYKTIKKEYLAFSYENAAVNDIYSGRLVFLLDIDKMSIISLGYSIYNPLKEFYDTNNNGFIEILTLNKTGDTIYLKEVLDNKISKVKNKYILINNLDGFGHAFTIDTIKSSW